MNEIDTSTLDGKIAVMTASKEGRPIQCRTRGSKDEWTDVSALAWNWPSVDYRIKPLQFPPLPEGLEWHNPEGLTPEQVGEGFRLLVTSEVNIIPELCLGSNTDFVEGWERGKWNNNGGRGLVGCLLSMTYRVPISTPFPEPPKKVVMARLGTEDVPPGSVVAPFQWYDSKRWYMVLVAANSGVDIKSDGDEEFLSYETLQKDGWRIKRPGDDWKPCEKPAGS
jgi:hypothetical protein